MGYKGINISSLLVLFSLAVVLFGTRRLRDAGGDIAKAIKDFKQTMQDHEEPKS